MGLPKLDIPRYELTLPSTNEKVVYRSYLVKEEKILMLAMESNDQKQMIRAIKDVIVACTDGKLDPNKLTMFDLEYVFAMLRSKSVGSISRVGLKCQSCDATNEVDIELEKVRVEMPDKAPILDIADNVKIQMKYPDVNDIIDASGETSDIERVFDTIVSCIETIYYGEDVFDAKTQSKKDLKEFIESMNSTQFQHIRDFAENMPQCEVAVNYTCTSCGHVNGTVLKGMANFFE